MLDEILEAENEDPGGTLYERALSHLVAMKVAQRGDVEEFREAHLNGGVIPWTDIGDWIRRHEPPPGVLPQFYVSLPVADKDMQRAQRANMRGDVEEDEEIEIRVTVRDLLRRQPRPRSLQYIMPGEEAPRWAAIRRGTPLEDLSLLADSLGATTTWTEAQAVVFILTNQTPLIRQFTSEVAENIELPALTRITLHLDPRMSQRELARHFQSVRQELVHRRHRDIGTKHLTLALFSTTAEGRIGSLRDRMDHWNTQHPDWAYQHTTNFSRDTGVAIRRLLESSYDAMPAHTTHHTGDSEPEEE